MYSTIRSGEPAQYPLFTHKKGIPRIKESQFLATAQQSSTVSTERPIKLY